MFPVYPAKMFPEEKLQVDKHIVWQKYKLNRQNKVQITQTKKRYVFVLDDVITSKQFICCKMCL